MRRRSSVFSRMQGVQQYHQCRGRPERPAPSCHFINDCREILLAVIFATARQVRSEFFEDIPVGNAPGVDSSIHAMANLPDTSCYAGSWRDRGAVRHCPAPDAYRPGGPDSGDLPDFTRFPGFYRRGISRVQLDVLHDSQIRSKLHVDKSQPAIDHGDRTERIVLVL